MREWCHFSYLLHLIFCCCGDLDKDGPGGMEFFHFTSINKLKEKRIFTVQVLAF